MKEISFMMNSSFLGKNGCHKSIGLTVFKIGDIIQLYPKTSKTELGLCNISIPQSSIPELIDTLRLFLEGGSDTAPDPKAEKIAYIKKVIAEWGGTSCCERERDHSPSMNSLADGRVCELVEDFQLDGVGTVVYDDENEVDWNNYSYDELKDEIIDEIVEIMEDYEADMLKTEKRCKD